MGGNFAFVIGRTTMEEPECEEEQSPRVQETNPDQQVATTDRGQFLLSEPQFDKKDHLKESKQFSFEQVQQ